MACARTSAKEIGDVCAQANEAHLGKVLVAEPEINIIHKGKRGGATFLLLQPLFWDLARLFSFSVPIPISLPLLILWESCCYSLDDVMATAWVSLVFLSSPGKGILHKFNLVNMDFVYSNSLTESSRNAIVKVMDRHSKDELQVDLVRNPP